MKPNIILSRFNLAVAAMLLLLAGSLFLNGCGTTGDNDTNDHNHSRGRGSCH